MSADRSPLTVTPLSPGVYQVDGGSEPHRVEVGREFARCDCKGYAYRQTCRHLVAVGNYLVVAPLEATPLPAETDELVAAIEHDLAETLDHCAAKLDELEQRVAAVKVPVPTGQHPGDLAALMRRWHDKRQRLTAGQPA